MPRSTSTVIVGLLILVVPAVILPLSRVDAGTPSELVFDQAWERTDLPVADGSASRTWLWGLAPLSEILDVESSPESGDRQDVKYFEKGRMEIANRDGDSDSPGDVQSGAILTELIEGQVTSAEGETSELPPPPVTVAGDADDSNGLTYDLLSSLLSQPTVDEGTLLTTRVSADGELSEIPELAAYDIRASELVVEADHRIASVFWEFMNSSGIVWNGFEYVEEPLFPEPLSATGLPLTEAYWLYVRVSGVQQDVLLQCFERRCLTFTPGNPDGWQVESNNAGAHYYEWRYDRPKGEAPGESTEGPGPELPIGIFETAGGASHEMRLEVAATDATRACGLMHRLELEAETGMLFVFEQDHQGSFWNCNTFVPLTLAWIDADGVIIGFSEMDAQVPGESQDVVSYPPPGSYRYVIEANQGWFAERGIADGDTVDLAQALERGDTGSDTLCQELGLDCN